MGRIPGASRKLARPLSSAERKAQIEIPDLPAPPLAGSRVNVPLQGLKYPIWTENKARLIQRYLVYFTYVTKHGTYIDGFAGPQEPDKPDAWAAKLVLEAVPRRLRHFFLCEINPAKVNALKMLRDGQPPRRKGEPKRTIEVYSGDFNAECTKVLDSGTITEKEATFCLLDQRTFECKWSTVEAIAKHKKTGKKIEIFYFLAAHWFMRSFKSLKGDTVPSQWWGRNDWQTLNTLRDQERADLFCARFRDELGYGTANAWPIYSNADGGRIKYHMVHATDHPEAPKLMWRAYHQAVLPMEPPEQLDLLAQLMDA